MLLTPFLLYRLPMMPLLVSFLAAATTAAAAWGRYDVPRSPHIYSRRVYSLFCQPPQWLHGQTDRDGRLRGSGQKNTFKQLKLQSFGISKFQNSIIFTKKKEKKSIDPHSCLPRRPCWIQCMCHHAVLAGHNAFLHLG